MLDNKFVQCRLFKKIPNLRGIHAAFSDSFFLHQTNKINKNYMLLCDLFAFWTSTSGNQLGNWTSALKN